LKKKKKKRRSLVEAVDGHRSEKKQKVKIRSETHFRKLQGRKKRTKMPEMES
jgi:hypothetical protein